MLLVEENHKGASTSMHTDRKMMYMKEDKPHDHGGRGGSARNGGGRQEQKQEGIIERLTIVSDPSEAGGVKAALGTDKERTRPNASCHNMARHKPMTSWYMGRALNHSGQWFA